MGNGRITLEQAQSLLSGKSVEEQLPFIYQAAINQSHICENRPSECDKRYVLKGWFRSKVAFFSGVGATVSFIGVAVVMKILNIF